MKDLFELLVEETAAEAKVAKGTIPLSRKKSRRWIDLACFWEGDGKKFPNVFYVALYHIARGTYPRTVVFSKTLVALVEKAILENDEALNAWRQMVPFCDAFLNVSRSLDGCEKDRRWSSTTMRRFVLCRFYLLTIFRRDIGVPVNRETMSTRQMKKAQKVAAMLDDYLAFKKCIVELIPEAEAWKDEWWLFEKRIFKCLNKNYGYDYACNLGEFDDLCQVMKNKRTKTPYYRVLFQIKAMPEGIAKIVWGEELKRDLSRQLLTAARQKPIDRRYGKHTILDSINPLVLTQSWAYKRLLKFWADRDQLSPKTNAALLSFGMNIHPALVGKAGT